MNFYLTIIRLPLSKKSWINFFIEFVHWNQQPKFQNNFTSLSIFEYIHTVSLYLYVKMKVLLHSVQHNKLERMFLEPPEKIRVFFI